MFQRKIKSIAQAHRFPVALPDADLPLRDRAVMLRYDGKASAEDDKFFVVIPLTDLAKIRPGRISIEESDVDGESIFFRETPAGVAVYLDADSNSERLLSLRDMAASGEIALIDYIGDLRIMGAPHNLVAPTEAAYEQNGFPEVSAGLALSMLHDLSSKLWEQDNDRAPLSP